MTLASVPKNKPNFFSTKEINILNCLEYRSEIGFLRWDYQLGSLKEKKIKHSTECSNPKTLPKETPLQWSTELTGAKVQQPMEQNQMFQLSAWDSISPSNWWAYQPQTNVTAWKREFCPLFWSVWCAFQYVTALGVAHSWWRKTHPLKLEFRVLSFSRLL